MGVWLVKSASNLAGGLADCNWQATWFLCFSFWKWGIAPFEKQLDMKSQVLNQQIWKPKKMVPCLSWCFSISFSTESSEAVEEGFTPHKKSRHGEKRKGLGCGVSTNGETDGTDESHRAFFADEFRCDQSSPSGGFKYGFFNHTDLVGGLEHGFYDFPFSWECHHPNWLIFFRGFETTNQNHMHVVIQCSNASKRNYM